MVRLSLWDVFLMLEMVVSGLVRLSVGLLGEEEEVGDVSLLEFDLKK